MSATRNHENGPQAVDSASNEYNGYDTALAPVLAIQSLAVAPNAGFGGVCGPLQPKITKIEVSIPALPYRYAWSPRMPGVPGDTMGNRKGQLCRVLIRGGRNSALIEFADGFLVVGSRNALRRAG